MKFFRFGKRNNEKKDFGKFSYDRIIFELQFIRLNLPESHQKIYALLKTGSKSRKELERLNQNITRNVRFAEVVK